MRINWIVFVVCFFHFQDGISQNLTANNQLLWQITGNGLKKPSYLFGSYHSNDPKVFKLSDSTYSAFNQAEALVLEADIYELFLGYDMRLGNVDLKFDANGNPYTSNQKASLTKYGNEDGRPQFLDLYFQQVAYNMNKEFFALETIEQQMEVLDFVYERTNAQKSLEQLRIIQNNLFQAYLRGDIEQVKTIIQSQMNHSKDSYERLINKRNVIMVNGIDTLCKKKSLFITVGAGHLAGEEGIITLLRKKGYQVRQVIASFSAAKSSAEQNFLKHNTYLYKNKDFDLKAVFSGKPVIDSTTSVYRITYQEMGQGNTFTIEIENLFKNNLESYVKDVLDQPDEAKYIELLHQNKIPAFEGIGYDFSGGLAWKRVFVHKDKLIKLICYGGNKFMNSNRPQQFFNRVEFEINP